MLAAIIIWLHGAPVDAWHAIQSAWAQMDASERSVGSVLHAQQGDGIPQWLRVELLQEWQLAHPETDISTIIRQEILQ